jgi:TonB family protein
VPSASTAPLRLSLAVVLAVGLHAAVLSAVVLQYTATDGFGGAELEAVSVGLIEASALEQRSAATGSAASRETVTETAGNAPVMQAEAIANATPSEPVALEAEQTPREILTPAETATIQPTVEPPPTPAASPSVATEARVAGSAAARAETAVVAAAPAAAAAAPGVVRDYTAGVIAVLAKTKPTGRGSAGKVRVVFTISDQGRPEDLRVTASSGRPTIDALALDAVRRARFQSPPAAMTVVQRTYAMGYTFR